MKIRACALALLSGAVVAGSPNFASAHSIDAKSITCAAFLAMTAMDKTETITSMHAVSPDGENLQGQYANAEAVVKTKKACKAARDMTAYDAMTSK